VRLGGRVAAAAEIVADMDARRRPVADALKDWGLSHRFAGSGDRAAIGNLVYDVLRRRRSLSWRMGSGAPADLVIGALLAEPSASVEALAKALDGDRFAPPLPDRQVLDAFLARDVREAPDAIRADLPDWLAARFAEAFGGDWVAEAEALAARPPLDMRVNTLLAEREAVERELSPFEARPSPLSPAGLRIDPIAGDRRHPNVQVEAAFQTGQFEIQDEGSQIVALLAGPAAGQRVLDYCAGAGGKTLALGAAMGNAGEIHAFDADRSRLAPIHERLRRAGLSNVEVHAPRDDLSPLEGAMDLVLVDAPCTGTGTWRRRPDAKWRLSEGTLAKRMAEQDGVLDRASGFVRPGGRLAFVTCSLLPEENGRRVEAFLTKHPDYRVEDARALWRDALPGVPERYRAEKLGDGRGLLLSPGRTGTDGFFFAAMQRQAGG
jgi:16S rRNA (cytosine967-C5)-methyltransferase